jgi:uncharacterized protein (TIGR02145 family)
MAYTKFPSKVAIALIALVIYGVQGVQAQLDEQVPYQGDTLLTNPNQFRVTSAGDVLMDCDWPAMMAMIRDLEERIAGETETDTTYGVYVSGGINGSTVNMWYDCVVLRDSILSLQVAYDEVLAPRVTVDAAVVLSDTSAALSASFSGSGVGASGFAWAEDYTTTPHQGNDTGTSSPIADTLTGLDAGTVYYFSAYAVKEAEYFYGDTLSFLTMPGITTDAADELTTVSATLNATFSADSITAQGFVWGSQADLSDGASVSADTTGGSTAIEYALTGLTEDATYYFSAYATNASGTTYGDTLSFVAQLSPCGDLTSVSYQGYDYNIVGIGTQCWFAENLRNEDYNDGSTIPSGLDPTAWSNTSDGAVSVYGWGGANEASNLADYGRLYNWYAVNTGNLCPSDWHVSTDAEWTTLTDGLGATIAGSALKSSFSDTPDWNGTNSSGFSGLAGGYRSDAGQSSLEGSYGYFWTSTPNGTKAGQWHLRHSNEYVSQGSSGLGFGFSVRCVLDE